MRELVDRLTALDPDASESLKVISYFDALVEAHAGLEAFLRGAALYTGCPAGLALPDHGIRMRVDAGGRRTPAPAGLPDLPDGWPSRRFPNDPESVVWVERSGPARDTDAIVLERCAAGARITVERTRGGPTDAAAVEMLLDDSTLPDARRRAAWRLDLNDQPLVFVTASPPPPGGARLPARTTLMNTAAGIVAATLWSPDHAPGDFAGAGGRVGIGPAGPMGDLPASFAAAVVALRLTTRRRPAVRWADLGGLTVLAAAADAAATRHPDVERVETYAADDAGFDTLEALASHDSVRAAAAALGLHHSTVQARLERLEAHLGYPLATAEGRTRLALALALYQLGHNRFGEPPDTHPPSGG